MTKTDKELYKKQLDYLIALQKAIECHCRKELVPERIRKRCPHHAEMLDQALVGNWIGKPDQPMNKEIYGDG